MAYNISLTQFCNYLTKTSRQKAIEARNIALSLADDYQCQTDYWLHLRNGVKHVMASTGIADDLDIILEKVPQDRIPNHQIMIDGLKKFWGQKVFRNVRMPKRAWKHSRIHVNINLEICGEYKNKIYLIKFFAHVNKTIRKDETDMMLLLMHEALLPDIEAFEEKGKKVVLGVLDVAKGSLHPYRAKLFSYQQDYNNSFPIQVHILYTKGNSLVYQLHLYNTSQAILHYCRLAVPAILS